MADEKILSQQLFDQLVELLRRIRNDAAQRKDDATYGDADNAVALVGKLLETYRIEMDQMADTKRIMVGRALGMAADVLRADQQWHDEHSEQAGDAIAAVEHSLETWWPPDSDD